MLDYARDSFYFSYIELQLLLIEQDTTVPLKTNPVALKSQ